MRKRVAGIILFFLILYAILNIYSFTGIQQFTGLFEKEIFRNMIHWGWWIIPFFLIFCMILFMSVFYSTQHPVWMSLFYETIGMFMLLFIPNLFFTVFLLLQDLLSSLYNLVDLMLHFSNDSFHFSLRNTPLRFISISGLMMYTIALIIILYGILFGRFNFRIKNVTIPLQIHSSNLDGIRIIQISDLHIGSLWFYQKRFKKVIRMINDLTPDIILFTGDMVNDLALEMNGWKEILGILNARYGKYSILGNHDYGEYYNWDTPEDKSENLRQIIIQQEKMGFQVLANSSVEVDIEGERIGILGVENWGLPPFKQYGDLEKAMSGTNSLPFKILMSHDPSHWDAEVLGKTDIDLTLSGHTHGFQFGIRTRWFTWSPVQYKYPRWEGLHKTGNQYLNVNTGLGYIGFPGRIGIPPEVTCITLETKRTSKD